MCYKQGKFYDRREMLKVKLKSLAEEARIIRKEERKAPPAIQADLYSHRVTVVRYASRKTHIAYGIIRGRSWQDVEAKPCFDEINSFFEDIQKMVRRYGSSYFHNWNYEDMKNHPEWSFPQPGSEKPKTMKERLLAAIPKLVKKKEVA